MSVVGILSPGAMGSAVGSALHAGGTRVVATLAGRSERTASLAREHGLELLPALDDVVQEADLLLSIVPPAAALAVAVDVAAAADRTGALPLVADLNAIAPQTARSLGQALEEVGLRLSTARSPGDLRRRTARRSSTSPVRAPPTSRP